MLLTSVVLMSVVGGPAMAETLTKNASTTPQTAPSITEPSADAPDNIRVGGDMDAEVVMKDGLYTAGRSLVEEALPEGYPAPTPPGAIDIKYYPSVRRAAISSDTVSVDQGTYAGFFPLFNHIKSREIAMTSPVEMDYAGMGLDGDTENLDSWTMSFLYRTKDLGPTGQDGRIEVYDTEPVTVVSIGVRGPYGMRTAKRGMQELEAWFDNQSEWEIAGDPRSFSYNGPYIPDAVKWSEVQVPVQRVVTVTPVSLESASSEHSCAWHNDD
ncbi:MAG: heme-binding protein [Planctomycetota bacterium]